jgi:hypothetical protein
MNTRQRGDLLKRTLSEYNSALSDLQRVDVVVRTVAPMFRCWVLPDNTGKVDENAGADFFRSREKTPGSGLLRSLV